MFSLSRQGSHICTTRVHIVLLNCSVMLDSSQPHGLQAARLLWPQHFPSKNTGVGGHFLIQRIFLTSGQNLSLLHYRQLLYHWALREAHVYIYIHIYVLCVCVCVCVCIQFDQMKELNLFRNRIRKQSLFPSRKLSDAHELVFLWWFSNSHLTEECNQQGLVARTEGWTDVFKIWFHAFHLFAGRPVGKPSNLFLNVIFSAIKCQLLPKQCFLRCSRFQGLPTLK